MPYLRSLKDLATQLAGARHPYVPTTMTFSPLDVDTIARDLDLKKTGTDRGARDKPDSQLNSFDGIEKKIVSYVDRTKATATQLLDDGPIDASPDHISKDNRSSIV